MEKRTSHQARGKLICVSIVIIAGSEGRLAKSPTGWTCAAIKHAVSVSRSTHPKINTDISSQQMRRRTTRNALLHTPPSSDKGGGMMVDRVWKCVRVLHLFGISFAALCANCLRRSWQRKRRTMWHGHINCVCVLSAHVPYTCASARCVRRSFA